MDDVNRTRWGVALCDGPRVIDWTEIIADTPSEARHLAEASGYVERAADVGMTVVVLAVPGVVAPKFARHTVRIVHTRAATCLHYRHRHCWRQRVLLRARFSWRRRRSW